MPITFTCTEAIPQPPEEIAAGILDVASWTDFVGYGPLPGIKEAVFDPRTPEIVGSLIRVANLDGSSHVEEIVVWEPRRRVELHMGSFSPPLSKLATHFIERWAFDQEGEVTWVHRSFAMYARSWLTWPLLWLISWMLRSAIKRHLRHMREGAEEGHG